MKKCYIAQFWFENQPVRMGLFTVQERSYGLAKAIVERMIKARDKKIPDFFDYWRLDGGN